MPLGITADRDDREVEIGSEARERLRVDVDVAERTRGRKAVIATGTIGQTRSRAVFVGHALRWQVSSWYSKFEFDALADAAQPGVTSTSASSLEAGTSASPFAVPSDGAAHAMAMREERTAAASGAVGRRMRWEFSTPHATL